MEKKEIYELLDALSNAQAFRDVLMLQKQAIVDTVITPEIKEQLEEIELEFADKFTEADERIAAARERAKAAVLEFGKTVKTEFLTASPVKGSVSWDDDILLRYAEKYPEIMSARKVGNPYVRIK